MTTTPITLPVHLFDLRIGDHFTTIDPSDHNAVFVVADARVREFSRDGVLLVQVQVQTPGAGSALRTLRGECDVLLTSHRPCAPEVDDEDLADDGRVHAVGDDCLAVHYEDNAGRLVCGADFMAGTICSLRAGHVGPDAAECLDCGGDWMSGTCTCEIDEDED